MRTRALVALLLCALPGRASAASWQLDPSQKGDTELIRYRALARGDFRAAGPPPQARGRASQLGAATCSYLVPDRESLRIRATPRKRKDGRYEYVAQPDRLRFHGAMDRRCSWWNTRQKQLPPDYVLEHEQIHFALTEIHARRLNQRAEELVRRMTAVHADADAAIAASQRALEALLRDESEALLARNDRFDADTSFGIRRENQSAWRARVERELAEVR